MKKAIKIQDWFFALEKVAAISEVVLVDVDNFGKAYGFEVVVDGETLPFTFASEKDAYERRDALLTLLLINAEIIDLEKILTQKQGEKNEQK